MNAEQFATHWHGDQVRKIEHCREIVEILKTEGWVVYFASSSSIIAASMILFASAP